MAKRTFAILTTILAFCVISTTSVKYTFIPSDLPNHHKLHTGAYIESANHLVSPGLIFGLCTGNIRDSRYEDFCTFAIESNKDIGHRHHLRFCNFTFPVTSGYNSGYRFKQLVAIDDSKALMIMRDWDSISVHLLDFSFCDSAFLHLDSRDIEEDVKIFAPSDDIFDLVMTNRTSGCSNCRIIYNFYGDVLVDLEDDWFDKGGELDPKDIIAMIHSRNQLRGRLVALWARHPHDKIEILTLNDNGSTDLLKSYHVDAIDEDDKLGLVSATYHHLSVCTHRSAKSTITCAQFNSHGVLKFEKTLSVSEFGRIHSMSVYNLPEGGLLLLIFEDSNGDKQCPLRLDFVVKKFDSKGRDIGTLRLSHFPCPYSLFVGMDKFHFFENNDGEMCLSYANKRFWNRYGRVNLDIACFNDQEFSL